MFEILACHGTAIVSQAIEELTSTPSQSRENVPSHIRIRFLREVSGLNANGEPVNIKAGQCVEAERNKGVRVCEWNSDYPTGTRIDVYSLRDELIEPQFQIGAMFLCRQIGKPYDWQRCDALAPGMKHFITPPDAGLTYWQYDAWFCSELAAALMEIVGLDLFNYWRCFDVSPEMTINSIRLTPIQSLTVS